MEIYLEQFIDYLISLDLNEQTTIPQYRTVISDFIFFVKKLEIEDIHQVQTIHLDRYQSHLKKINKAASIRKKMSILKHFFQYLHSREYISKNPSITLERIRVKDSERKKKEILSPKEARRLIESVEKNSYGPTKLRNKLLFTILLFDALRVSEICKLKTSDIDFKKRTLYIWNGKGEKNREVPINEELASMISQYLKSRKKDSIFLFSGRNPNLPLSQKAVFKTVVFHVNKAKILKRTTPHSLRHASATIHRLNGVDVRTIQLLLGHSSINTTMIYLNEDSEHMKNEIRSKNHLLKGL